MKAYTIEKVLKALDEAKNIRKEKKFINKLSLNKVIKDNLNSKFDDFYNFYYKIFNNKEFYLNILKSAYSILKEIVTLVEVRTLQADIKLKDKIEKFKIKLNVLNGYYAFNIK